MGPDWGLGGLQHHILSEEPHPRQGPTDSQGCMRLHRPPAGKVASWQLICSANLQLGWKLRPAAFGVSAVQVVGAAPLASADCHIHWICPVDGHRESPGLHCTVVAPLAAAKHHVYWLYPMPGHRDSQSCTTHKQRCGAWPGLDASSTGCPVRSYCARINTPCHWGLRHVSTDIQAYTLQLNWSASKWHCW